MQGKANVIARLNHLLTGELSAADQYFAHAKMLENWGFQDLYEHFWHERNEELEHADRLAKRILFLEGTPDFASRVPLNIGSDVPSILRNDLALEISVVQELKDAIALCEQEQDYETRHLLRELLADTEEDHAHWLEQQLFLISQIGLQNYLQTSIGRIRTGA